MVVDYMLLTLRGYAAMPIHCANLATLNDVICMPAADLWPLVHLLQSGR